jgi:hypothetical protein
VDEIFPVEAEPENIYSLRLGNGEKWEQSANVTLDSPGSFMVVFELWVSDGGSSGLRFTGNACVLNIEAVNQA